MVRIGEDLSLKGFVRVSAQARLPQGNKPGERDHLVVALLPRTNLHNLPFPCERWACPPEDLHVVLQAESGAIHLRDKILLSNRENYILFTTALINVTLTSNGGMKTSPNRSLLSLAKFHVSLVPTG